MLLFSWHFPHFNALSYLVRDSYADIACYLYFPPPKTRGVPPPCRPSRPYMLRARPFIRSHNMDVRIDPPSFQISFA